MPQDHMITLGHIYY